MGILNGLFGSRKKSKRKCEGCGKTMYGETPKLVSLIGPNQVLVRPYCSQECADPIVKSFIERKLCIWCGNQTEPESWKLGGYGEPYCSPKCYSEAGKEMFRFELHEGNI